MIKNKINIAELFKYGFFAIPYSFAGFPLYVLAPDFYATRRGVSLSALASILLALRLFDAFQDPLIGYLSDKYRHYTRIYMPFCGIILCISIYALFNLSWLTPKINFAVFTGLAVTCYSILNINLSSLGALWTKDKDHQTRIAAAREGFGLAGLIMAVSLPSLFGAIAPESLVYELFSLVLVVATLIAIFLFLSWYGGRTNNSEHQDSSIDFISSFKSLSYDSKKLLGIYFLSMFASSMPGVIVIFFVRDLLGAEQYTGLFLTLYFVSGGVFMGMWRRISVCCGKYPSWLYSMILAVVTFIWAFFLARGDIWQYCLICIASGAAFGGDLVMPPSLIADHIHINRAQKAASTYYASMVLAAKLSLALASFCVLRLLSSVGFMPAEYNNTSALFTLSLAYALIPSILKLISGALLWYLFIHPNKNDA